MWSNSADALIRAGRAREALCHVREAMLLQPENRGVFHWVAGLAHFALRELDEARVAFEAALRRNDAHCMARMGIAAVQVEMGRLADGRDTAQGAIALSHGLPYVQHLLGPVSSDDLRRRWIGVFSKLGVPAEPPQAGN